MPKRSQSRNRKCTTLISNTVIVSDTDSDTDSESAVRISFSTSESQCMVMITAVGLSNKYLNRPIGSYRAYAIAIDGEAGDSLT